MMHTKRRWGVVRVESATALAEKLVEYTWCGCQGFELAGYLFLNDSTSADGAQEYAVVKAGRQIESITFGWMNQERAEQTIHKVLRGEYDHEAYGDVPESCLDRTVHATCGACA